MPPKVSIIITARNYAKWLPVAMDSALGQNFDGFETVVIDDGSTDHTPEVLKAYADRPNCRFIRTKGVGLAGACNLGIGESRGEYIIRLDADDYFDESAVLVLANYLDSHPDIGMVFCDYYTIDASGEIIDQVRRQKVNDEVELLDRPALAAGAMYRRSCYDAIGGYNSALRHQEDYDFWIRFIEKFQVRNVSLPLMYYRQHGGSMSRNWEGRMQARRMVKRKFVQEHRDWARRKTMAVVPARADLMDGHKLPLLKLGADTLLGRCIAQLKTVEQVDRIVVSTEDEEIADHARRFDAEVPYIRDIASANPSVFVESVTLELLAWMERTETYVPDILVLRHPHSPFLAPAHIAESVDTMVLYGTDAVLTVMEDLTYHWQVGKKGLAPVGYKTRTVRQEKNLIFKEVSGLYVFSVPALKLSEGIAGGTIGHIEVAPENALRIRSRYEYWIAREMDKAGWGRT